MQNEKDRIFCTTKPLKTLQRTGFSAFNSLIENDDITKDLTKDTLRRVPRFSLGVKAGGLTSSEAPFSFHFFSIYCVSQFPVRRENYKSIPLNLNYSIVRIINAVLQTVHKRYPDLILVYRGDTMILTACLYGIYQKCT